MCRKHVLDACMYSRLTITQNKQIAQYAVTLLMQFILSLDATAVLRLPSFLLIKRVAPPGRIPRVYWIKH